MFKKLGILILIAASFGAGYYVGSTRLSELSKSFTDLKKSMTDKTSALETEVNRLRLRINLVDVRNHVMNALEEIDNRNFGIAKNELKAASEKADKAQDLAGPDLKPRLNLIKGRLSEIQSSRSGPPSQWILQLQDIKKEMNRMIDG